MSLAYNKAAEWGKQHHFKWILLMDQDTILPDNFIVAYLDAIRKHTDVCLFAPQVILLNDRPFSPSLRRGKACCLPEGFYPLQRYNTINSGRLINIEAFLNVRGYDEKIWLDFADYQFADRLKAVCGQFYMIPVVCRQPFSNHETDKQKLLRRFRIYVDCANHCKWDSFRDRIDHVYRVIRHAAGLICRTKDLKFLYILVVHFKIGRFLV